ncbi:hypothetical protein OIU91_06210 [Streptomyces sp. NBC_01456]|nr:hypothetical protein [Streptomyces sp. NBC_01456]
MTPLTPSWPEPSIREAARDDARYWDDRYDHDPDPDPDGYDDAEAA